MYNHNAPVFALFIVLFSIFLFIIIRQFWLWYWKISENTQTLKNIDKNLQFLVDIKQKELGNSSEDQ